MTNCQIPKGAEMSLNELIANNAEIDEIAAFLDGLNPEKRLSEIERPNG